MQGDQFIICCIHKKERCFKKERINSLILVCLLRLFLLHVTHEVIIKRGDIINCY